MKTATKIVLAVSLAMIVLGGGLATMAYAVSGGNIGVSWSEHDGFYRSTFIHASNRLEKGSAEPGAFTSVNINTDYGSVKLIESSAYRVEYNLLRDYSPVEISVDSGTLTVRNTPGNINGGFNFNLFGRNENNLNNAYIYVYYPKGTTFNSITITDSLGGINVSGTTATGVIDINADMGEVKLSQVRAGSIKVEADLGAVDFDTVTADTLDATLSMGEFTSRDCTLGDTNIDNDMGATTLRGDIAGNVDITCSMGSVEFNTSRPRSDFFVDLSTDMGHVEVDGQRYRAGDAGNSDAPYRVTVSCDMGSAELWFGR